MVNVTLHPKRGRQDPNRPNASVSARELEVPKKAEAQLKKGDSALRKSQLEAAELYYSKAIQIYPRFAQAENNLGIVLMREGRRAQGKAAFDRALLIDTRFAPAQVNLAKIAFDEKRFRDAFDLAREALKTEPLNTAALFVATQSAFFSGNYGETISYARTLHSLPHKQYALIHFLAGKSFEAGHRTVEAIAEYQTFISEDPTDPNVARARQLITVLQASRLSDSAAPQ
jgi:tetratricopeptide (TPR) repeat protein